MTNSLAGGRVHRKHDKKDEQHKETTPSRNLPSARNAHLHSHIHKLSAPQEATEPRMHQYIGLKVTYHLPTKLPQAMHIIANRSDASLLEPSISLPDHYVAIRKAAVAKCNKEQSHGRNRCSFLCLVPKPPGQAPVLKLHD